jgi:hypothetical protein
MQNATVHEKITKAVFRSFPIAGNLRIAGFQAKQEKKREHL